MSNTARFDELTEDLRRHRRSGPPPRCTACQAAEDQWAAQEKALLRECQREHIRHCLDRTHNHDPRLATANPQEFSELMEQEEARTSALFGGQ